MLKAEKLDQAIYIRVANGSTIRATYQGMVELNFTSDQGHVICLKLLRVLYVSGLQTQLFSIESFVSDGNHKVVYTGNILQLQFPNQITMSIDLPHQPSSSFFVISNINKLSEQTVNFIEPDAALTTTESLVLTPSKSDPNAGRKHAPTWKNNHWEEQQWHLKGKRKINLERAHHTFGHRAVSSLIWASKANVWDDVSLVAEGDMWCDSCKIATAPKKSRSKAPMRFKG